MNANELADKLLKNNLVSWSKCTPEEHDMSVWTNEQAATMLRQQQAEIEELKTCLIVEQEHNERMVEDRSKYEVLAHAGGVEAGKELKELTDEEIKEVWMNRPANTAEGVIEFARAILRKAQEK